MGAALFCPSCGRGFSSQDCLPESTPLLQAGREEAVRVCAECAELQLALHWLKCLAHTHTQLVHARTQQVHYVTLLCPCCDSAVTLLCPCCAPAVTLLCPCCAPAVTLLCPCCASAVPLL